MKKILIIVFILFSIGCSGVQNSIPTGKTIEIDWESDELSCRKSSGKVTGILAPTPIGLWENKINNADKRYMDCMIKLGWYK